MILILWELIHTTQFTSLKCTICYFLMLLPIFGSVIHLILEHYFHPKKETLRPSVCDLHFFFTLLASVTLIHILSPWIFLPLCILFKLNLITCSPVWLSFLLSAMFSKLVHVAGVSAVLYFTVPCCAILQCVIMPFYPFLNRLLLGCFLLLGYCE